MGEVIYTRQALDDLDRLTDFLLSTDISAATDTANLIAEAVEILRDHPLIGRAVEDDMRELVISRGKSGYVALYDYAPARNVVLILAVRHQREAGYADE